MDIELTEQQQHVSHEQVDCPVNAVNGVKPGIRAAQEAYWRDLPELLKLKSPRRQWVAYHWQQRIGFASTDGELYRKCERRGIPRGEFYVDRLEPRELPPWEEEVIECRFETEPPPTPSTS
jgi:hypothetical protein